MSFKVGQVMKVYRCWQCRTVREFANELGISPATLSRVENGKPMDMRTMMRFVMFLFDDREVVRRKEKKQ